MKKTLFKGAGVALVTPMKQDGSVDYETLSSLIEMQISGGTDAIIACGTTAESASMSYDERMQVIEFIVKAVDHRIPVIAGTGTNETHAAVKMSQAAQDMGADGLLVVTPYYNKTSQHGLVKHYFHIADQVDIPIITYNVPSRTGLNISAEAYAEICRHDNIVGTKEASGNISAVAKIRKVCGDNFDIYSGNDDQIVPIISLGGKGVISVLSNVLPKQTHDIVMACLNGDFKTGSELQIKYLDLINALFCDVNPIPVKQAMCLMGIPVGECRLPLCNMLPDKIEMMKNILTKHGLIK